MLPIINLNVYRHAAIPVLRGHERYDQADDPGFRVTNDDIDLPVAARQIERAACNLRLDRRLPLTIWHSDTRRTRRSAEFFARALVPLWAPPLVEAPELSEPVFELRLLVSREQFEHPARPSWLVRRAFFEAVLADNRAAVAGGRGGVAERVLRLRERLGQLPPGNVLWVSHGLLMPFLHLTLIDGIEPDGWTLEHILAVGAGGGFGYAEGFAYNVLTRGQSMEIEPVQAG